ncbi:hypothetical protein [Sphingomonas colocasiae]|uniref:Uncharacterized protein n=1 Tax=Sphingomonas colocasiae TaxID=1848973 RepID=A0ABS7PRT4_9SPHN|nr:hypothetical protein [Sphingomonas colocasiae]MBY8824034.1 hypothetical protein [Sphingomonas colocasiae]
MGLEELAAQAAEIERLKASFNTKENLVRAENDYLYRVDESGHKVGYPFRPRCESLDSRMIQLVRDGRFNHAKCPACGTTYTPVTAYYPPAPGQPERSDERMVNENKASSEALRSAGAMLGPHRWMAK